MGIFADLLANASAIDTTLPREGSHRITAKRITDIIRRLGDQDYPSGMSATNEVQGIAIHSGTVTSGTFTLTITLLNGVTFTTGTIAYNANAATIQSAIDTAAAKVVQGWTNGDIAITGGPLTTTPLVVTFSGVSVRQSNHPLLTGNGASLVGGGTLGAITQTTAGQPLRTAMAALIALGVLETPAPALRQGASPPGHRGRSRAAGCSRCGPRLGPEGFAALRLHGSVMEDQPPEPVSLAQRTGDLALSIASTNLRSRASPIRLAKARYSAALP